MSFLDRMATSPLSEQDKERQRLAGLRRQRWADFDRDLPKRIRSALTEQSVVVILGTPGTGRERLAGKALEKPLPRPAMMVDGAHSEPQAAVSQLASSLADGGRALLVAQQWSQAQELLETMDITDYRVADLDAHFALKTDLQGPAGTKRLLALE